MEHPWPLQVCTTVSIIYEYDAHRGQGDKGCVGSLMGDWNFSLGPFFFFSLATQFSSLTPVPPAVTVLIIVLNFYFNRGTDNVK